MNDQDPDEHCTKCGSKDPQHLADVRKYDGCRR